MSAKKIAFKNFTLGLDGKKAVVLRHGGAVYRGTLFLYLMIDELVWGLQEMAGATIILDPADDIYVSANTACIRCLQRNQGVVRSCDVCFDGFL